MNSFLSLSLFLILITSLLAHAADIVDTASSYEDFLETFLDLRFPPNKLKARANSKARILKLANHQEDLYMLVFRLRNHFNEAKHKAANMKLGQILGEFVLDLEKLEEVADETERFQGLVKVSLKYELEASKHGFRQQFVQLVHDFEAKYSGNLFTSLLRCFKYDDFEYFEDLELDASKDKKKAMTLENIRRQSIIDSKELEERREARVKTPELNKRAFTKAMEVAKEVRNLPELIVRNPEKANLVCFIFFVLLVNVMDRVFGVHI